MPSVAALQLVLRAHMSDGSVVEGVTRPLRVEPSEEIMCIEDARCFAALDYACSMPNESPLDPTGLQEHLDRLGINSPPIEPTEEACNRMVVASLFHRLRNVRVDAYTGAAVSDILDMVFNRLVLNMHPNPTLAWIADLVAQSKSKVTPDV